MTTHTAQTSCHSEEDTCLACCSSGTDHHMSHLDDCCLPLGLPCFYNDQESNMKACNKPEDSDNA